MREPLNFEISATIKDGLGRAGKIKTLHGDIETPAFVPVGTKGTVKALTPEQVKSLGAQVVLANTYHLYLQPGADTVQNAGGLHSFMNWHGPTMTDSGGFQVFSLGAAYEKGLKKVTAVTDPSQMIAERSVDSDKPRLATVGNQGVSFRSHLDGSLHYFTPSSSIEIQHKLGADIIFAFDECTSPVETKNYQEEALERTHRWAKESLEYHVSKDNSSRQALFGVVQGGRDEALRKKSASYLAELNVSGKGFDGFGIGGSFAKDDLATAVQWVNETLPADKPRHLLGIGEPEDLFMGVERGVDLFDCVAPTRMGRNGTLYTTQGKINITNAQFSDDFSPIDKKCDCYTCANYSRAYVSHLFRAKEMLAGTLASVHNLRFIVALVDNMRASIGNGDFEMFKKHFLNEYRP